MEKKKGFFAEFKEFISRGSVIDLAVGVIIGAAFTAIVTSLVNDLIMPVIGWILGGTDFSKYQYVITEAVGDVPANVIKYGSFIQAIIHFLLIALVVFTIVKLINRSRRKKEEAPAPAAVVDPQIELLTEIRDSLKK